MGRKAALAAMPKLYLSHVWAQPALFVGMDRGAPQEAMGAEYSTLHLSAFRGLFHHCHVSASSAGRSGANEAPALLLSIVARILKCEGGSVSSSQFAGLWSAQKLTQLRAPAPLRAMG